MPYEFGIEANPVQEPASITEMVAMACFFASIQVPDQSNVARHGPLDRKLLALVVPLGRAHLLNVEALSNWRPWNVPPWR